MCADLARASGSAEGPAGAHDEPFQNGLPTCRRIKTACGWARAHGRRRPGHGRRLVERAARPDHPRPARPALRQYPQVVGSAAESVYAFTFYVFQTLNRWPTNGEETTRATSTRSPYLTRPAGPSCAD